MYQLRRLTKWLAPIVAAFSLAGTAAAADYPTKPIRLVVPVAAGGGTDFTARLIGQHLAEALGQAVVVENRPGGAGNLGVDLVAKAAPDGYTLVMPITSFPINPSLYSNLPFDTLKDFSPVVLTGSFPLLLVVNPSVPANSVADLIALAKKKPRELNFANSGTGTTAHLAGELFKRMAGVDIVSVNYKGGGPAVADLIGGHVQMYFSTIPAVLQQVETGRLRALAVTGTQRVSELPNVPTVAESGLPGFEVRAWFGVFAPARTPRPIIDKLNHEIGRILARPDVREKMAAHGFMPGGGTPEELGTFLNAEIGKWGKLIKEIGLRLD